MAVPKQELPVQLYQIDGDKPVEQVICEINKLGEKDGLGLDVFAEPNYHISPAPENGGWSGGGSSWTQNGEWVGLSGGGMSEAPDTAFQAQWAFDATHIGLFDDDGNRLVENEGEGIRIAIFDTSPFEGVVGWDEQEFSCQGQPAPLTVFHPPLAPSPNCPGYDRYSGDSLEDQDISNHGLFVAGLVHAVAPSSEIYLIRVLEDDGCGSLSGINSSIQSFIDKTLQEKGTLEGTVINLSLGVHHPSKPTRYGLPAEVVSLQRILKAAVDQGAVVIAAAGNDAHMDVPTSAMEYPANYSFIIGVAASNLERDRGCFSNAGLDTDRG